MKYLTHIKQDYILALIGISLLMLSGCCPATQQTKDMTLAQKCQATPSCKAALDKLSNDVK